MINDPYYRRPYVISGIAVVIVVTFIIRLFYLQVIDKSTADQAESNALIKQTIYPSRGLIYDRNGELLVFNQPIYEVTMVVRDMGKQFDTLSFCNCLNISPEEFNSRMMDIKDTQKNKGYSSWTPQVFMNQLKKEDIAALQESLYLFPGIHLQKRTLRDYTYCSAAHVLGSVGEVNQSDIERDAYYGRGDYSGRDGLEKTYEKQLRGEKGVEVLMRDARGRLQGSYQDGRLDKPAKAGTDLQITIDIQLQMLAEELLANKIGSAVAIEPKTGEILALVSTPAWDPKVLVGKERSANYNAMLKDPKRPLYNRATQATYPPGSTFKTIMTLVCLHQKGITSNTVYGCSGKESKPIPCTHHHGATITLENAIEQSCNPYFWCAFRDLLQKDGYGKDNADFRKRYESWRNDVMTFGLGQKFQDADVGDQSSGSIPSLALYDKLYGKTGWKAITIRSLSIGQGELLVTPLQLANQAAIIANDGYYITPHLNKNDSMLTHIHHVDIEKPYFDILKNGMRRVMVYGTGRHVAIDSLHMAGKTGTAQNPHGDDHAVFIGMALVEDPQIVVAVVVETSGYGATWAAPVASMMMEQYLTGDVKRKKMKQDYIHKIPDALRKKQ